MKGWTYEGWAKVRPYEPAHPRYNPNEPGKTKHPEADFFNYYSLTINKRTFWANVKWHREYGETLYTIEEDKPDDLVGGIYKKRNEN
jgi:hypothetical protein